MKYFFIKFSKFAYVIFWIAMLILFLPSKFLRFLWDGHNLKWYEYSFNDIRKVNPTFNTIVRDNLYTPKQSLGYLMDKEEDCVFYGGISFLMFLCIACIIICANFFNYSIY